MRRNHARERLESGEPSVGTWLSIPSPEAAGLIARLGFDWLTVDAEHNPVDILTLSRMFDAISAFGTAPMVRIPWNTPEHFKRVLDCGAWGVVVPMVNSKAEAEQAVDAARYHPLGSRSVGGSGHAMSFRASSTDYYARANDEILLVLQIEHIDAVERCDEILGVPGVDACFIGPNDLAASMGLGLGTPLESDEPAVVEAIEHVLNTARGLDVAPGIHTSGVDGLNMRISQGFQFLALASESRFMVSSLTEAISDLNWSPSPREGDTADPGEARPLLVVALTRHRSTGGKRDERTTHAGSDLRSNVPALHGRGRAGGDTARTVLRSRFRGCRCPCREQFSPHLRRKSCQ